MGRALLVLQTPHDRQKAISWINKAPVGTRVEFKASKRTLPQNDLLWALLTDVAQQLDHGGRKYEPSQWKAIFLNAFGREISFLPSLDLKTFLPIELSSSDLSKDEMTNLIEFILKEGAERGVIFHIPKDTNTGEDVPSPAGDDEPSPKENPSAGSASVDPKLWLLNVTRMLWAVATPGGDLDVLKNQKKSALIAFEKPEGCPQQIAEKADAVYRRCQDVINRSLEQADALAIIAGNVGVDQDDILRRAEW